MILILIRHGRTSANEKHLYCGKTDLGLSANGIDELMNKRSRTLTFEASSMRFLTSGMKRCEETLKLLYPDVPHEQEPAFREIDFGRFEMRSYEDLKDDPEYVAWISGDNERNVPPDGESGIAMKARVIKGLRQLTDEGTDTLLVTHGGVISAIMEFLFAEEGKNRYEWQPESGNGYFIDLAKHTYFPIG